MSADFDVVSGIVADVARVWGEYTDRLEVLVAQLAELDTRARANGVRRPNQLLSTEQSVREAKATAYEDPLAFEPGSVAMLEAQLARARTTLEEAVQVRLARTDDLAEARRAIDAGAAAVEACRERLNRLAVKVFVREDTWNALNASASAIEQLRTDCEAVALLGAEGGSGGFRHRAEVLVGDVGRLAAAAEARLARRDELRGLLTAYHAKAQAVGLAESLDVDEAYGAALDALYSAPCALEAGERLVDAFLQAVRTRSETSR
jgi:hypothetical protein